MTVVYRKRIRNLVWAVFDGSIVFLLAAGIAAYVHETASVVVWLAPGLVVCGTVLVVRCRRRGVVVDDTGITGRAACATWFVAWPSIKALRFAGDNGCAIERIGGGDPITIAVHPAHDQPTLRQACGEWRREDRDFVNLPQRYPQAGRDGLRVAFIASIIALLIGLPVWIGALRDADAYADRAARERSGVAVVSDVWVKETSDGEGDPDHTTYVVARLRLEDGRVYEIEVHRPDDVASDYEGEDPLPVVYDSAHPRDADFADRPTRQAQDDSVSLRTVTGPLFFFAGLLGVVVIGALMRHDWRGRLR
jgi:hypothetical protein